jgi:Zn-dependent protease
VTPQFSVFGIPVRVHGSFWLTALLLGFIQYQRIPWAIGAWILAVFVAVLLHELGHALMFRRFGVASEVHLVAMGGLTRPLGGRLTQWRHILVSFAGPAVGIVLGGATLAFQIFGPPPARYEVGVILDMIVWTNLGWALFNLVPIQPLDGGNIVAAALDRFFGIRGQRWARIISIVVACALIALGLAFRQIFLVVMIAMLAVENYRAWQLQSQWSSRLEGQAKQHAAAPRDAAPIESELRAAWSALESGDARAVRRIAESLLARTRTDDDRFQVAHLLAWGKLLTGDPPGAAQALRFLPRGQRPDALLEGAILLEHGRPADAVGPLTEAIVDRNDDFVATRLARAASSSARIGPLLALLRDREKSESAGVRALQVVVNEVFYAGHHAAAAELGELLFARFGQANDAFNVACSLGRAGRPSEAITWLEKAIDAGLADPTVLDTDADLAPVRALPAFDALRSRAGLSARPA